ncbi:hypothetical protein FGRMN_4657 [Fusarium graminum]|nr:hypothetical protein FGRMN_4657 [Fusarium graminum]
MDYDFGQDAPSGSGSGSGSWLGFGQRVTVTSSSPGAPNTMPEADDASFAESYRPEASPLFNPLFMSRPSAIIENAPTVATSPGPAPTWPWQRDATSLDETTFNTDTLGSPDALTLSEQNTRMFSSPEKPAPQARLAAQISVDAHKVASPERAPFSPLQESATPTQEHSIAHQEIAQEIAADDSMVPPPVVEESRIEIHEHVETIVQSSEKQPEELLSQDEHDSATRDGETERVEETPTETPAEPASDGDDKPAGSQETPAQQQSKSAEPNSAPAAGPGSLRSALLSVGRGLMKRMSAPPPAFAIPTQPDDAQTRRAMSSEPEQQPEKEGSISSLVVALKPMSEPEKAIFTSEAGVPDQEALPADVVPASSAKRGRPRKTSLAVNPVASATKSSRGRRSIASAPASPVAKKAPTAASKHVRKSMPASLIADETPKKRGRPRKSDAVATPAPPPSTAKRGRPRKSDAVATPVAAPSTAKRGRPRKSDATPIVVPSASKSLSARGRRVASAGKAVVTPRRTTSTQTPKTAIGLQAAAATPASTPRPRGRPAKISSQPSLEEVEPEVQASKRVGRATRIAGTTEDVPATTKKSTRAVKPRAVSSPAKRGRAAKTAAVAASTPSNKAEIKPATRRGRPAAEESAAEAPKRRGRPAKAEESAPEPKTRKRGRAVVTEDAAIEEPAPKKRGRAAKSGPEEEVAPAPKRRGRGVASKAAEDAAPVKKSGSAKTAKQAADNTASGDSAPKKRGRAAASAKATEDAATETATKRGRAKRAAPEPEPEPEVESPEPPSKKRRTTRKAEEPAKASKTTTGRKAGRPTKATKNTIEEPMLKRGKSTRTKASESAPVEKVSKPAAKPRGRAAAKKTLEPAVEAEAEKPKARGRPTKAKSGKGELPSSKGTEAPATKRGRGAAAKTATTTTKAKGSAPIGVTKTGRGAQTGVRRGLRSRG